MDVERHPRITLYSIHQAGEMRTERGAYLDANPISLCASLGLPVGYAQGLDDRCTRLGRLLDLVRVDLHRGGSFMAKHARFLGIAEAAVRMQGWTSKGGMHGSAAGALEIRRCEAPHGP